LRSSALIECAHEETRRFIAEQHKLIADQTKRAAEAAKLGRDRSPAP
jgi:hypothetical protein